MDLILWRHAEAEAGEPDLGRRLTAKGQKQAAKMAIWLDRHLPDTCRILVSPAERAQQTAQALGRKFKTIDELAPGASCDDVLSVAGWPESREAVLVVGHQPSIGQVVSYLLCGEVQEWSIRKAAVWWLSRRARDDDIKTAIRAVVGPDFA